MTIVLWLILFVLSWPIALIALVAYPIVWLVLLPFRIIGISVSGILETLRAIITPCGNGRYIAQYKGTFAVIVPFAYETTHSARAEPGVT